MQNRFFAARQCWMVATVVVLLAGCVFGQSNGAIFGTVKDGNDAAIDGAAITLVNPAKSITQTASTNSDGNFVFPQLPPGVYTISVERAGFKKIEKSKIVSRRCRLKAVL